ncbi:hypothetical protein GALL_338920 [mine drainage metagenome]|uniref:Uncharacterized protein n=1 Tax=mine drainage metagenome TaxID=410659 RepID=A0A1J5QWR9_9ZZZZ
MLPWGTTTMRRRRHPTRRWRPGKEPSRQGRGRQAPQEPAEGRHGRAPRRQPPGAERKGLDIVVLEHLACLFGHQVLLDSGVQQLFDRTAPDLQPFGARGVAAVLSGHAAPAGAVDDHIGSATVDTNRTLSHWGCGWVSFASAPTSPAALAWHAALAHETAARCDAAHVCQPACDAGRRARSDIRTGGLEQGRFLDPRTRGPARPRCSATHRPGACTGIFSGSHRLRGCCRVYPGHFVCVPAGGIAGQPEASGTPGPSFRRQPTQRHHAASQIDPLTRTIS